MPKMQKMSSYGLFHTLKYRFIDFTKVVFKTTRRQIMSNQDLSHTWNHLYNFVQFASFESQDAENEFACPFDT
jgi:hypothetical protein